MGRKRFFAIFCFVSLLLSVSLSMGMQAAYAAAPNGYLILAGPSDATGVSTVQGFSGAVPGGSTVTITNIKTGDLVTATASNDGSFSSKIKALNGQSLSIQYSGSDPITILTFSPAIIGVMPTIGGGVNGMTIVDSYGYVTDSVGLRIVDLSAPNHPQVVGTVPTTTKAAAVAVSGQYAYVATAYNNNALSIIDISDKTNPHMASSLFPSSGGSCIALSVNGSTTLAYLGGYFNGKGSGLYVVDVSNPLAPSALGFISLGSSPQSLTVADRYVYLAMGSAGVQIVDVGNPNAPLPVTSYTAVGNASRLAFLQTSIGNTLAIPSSAGLKLVNVTNPAAPQLAAAALPTTMIYDVMATGGGQVAVTTGYPSNGLQILDVTLPASSRVLGALPTDGIGSQVYLGTSGLGLFTTATSSAALNVIDARTLAKLGSIPIVNNAMALAVSGTSVVTGTNTYNQVGGNRNTLFWTNNLNPKKPANAGLLGQYGVFTSAAFSESGQWVLLGGSNGTELQVIDAASQTVIGKVALPFGSAVNGIRVRGNLAYIAGGVGGLFIVDLGADGRAPKIIGTADTAGAAAGVDISGQYAYVADGSQGLQVVNISNPQTPTLLGAAVPTPASAQSIRVQGQYLYLGYGAAGAANGLAVFDLTNPSAPISIATLAITSLPRKIDVMGNLVFFASDNGGLIIIDVSNPLQPVVAKGVKTFGYCRDVKVSGNLVYLADDYAVQVTVAISPVVDTDPGPQPSCTYTLSAANQSFNASGGTGNVNVTASSSCSWTAASSDSWISITSGGSGSGNGTVSYSVASNTGSTSRTGTVTIKGQTLSINQSGQGCAYSISPTSQAIDGAGGSGSVNLTTSITCGWEAVRNDSWITITSNRTGSGNSTVYYVVAANTGTQSRTGTMTIAGQTATVNQAGVSCAYAINPTTQSASAAGGTGSVTVTTTGTCQWVSSSSQPWITITLGSSGSGSGTVGYSVAANTSTQARTGTMNIAGQTFTVNQAGVSCAYTISPTALSISAGGGTGSVTVTTTGTCQWVSSSSQPWITITSGSSGLGSGTAGYSVAANTSTQARTGTMNIAGQTFTVNQAGVSCAYAISPTALSISAGGGTGNVAVTTTGTCQWVSSSSQPWITITSGSSGSGSGTVGYSVAANTSTQSRSATMTIAGQTLTVNQAGVSCAYTINPTALSISAGGGTGSVTVTTTGTCQWVSSSSQPWITVTSGSSGSGSGTVGYSVAANTSTQARTGTMNIAGQTFTVNQAGVSCAYAISPTALSISAGGGTGNVAVTTTGTCQWVSSSSQPWITITSGSSGSGSGTVGYSVAANTSTQARTGTMTIAGQTFTVNQAGVSCLYAINPTTQSISAGGGTGSVTVTTTGTCQWVSSSSQPWITITSGSSGSGSGTVGYSVAANTSTQSRIGTMTIAGQTFTVVQAGQPTPARISVSPTSLNFGTVTVRTKLTKLVTVSNTGGANLTISSINLFGSSATQFSSTTNCTTLTPGSSCTIQVTFSATTAGIKSANMNIYSNEPTTPITGVSLIGTGR